MSTGLTKEQIVDIMSKSGILPDELISARQLCEIIGEIIERNNEEWEALFDAEN